MKTEHVRLRCIECSNKNLEEDQDVKVEDLAYTLWVRVRGRDEAVCTSCGSVALYRLFNAPVEMEA